LLNKIVAAPAKEPLQKARAARASLRRTCMAFERPPSVTVALTVSGFNAPGWLVEEAIRRASVADRRCTVGDTSNVVLRISPVLCASEGFRKRAGNIWQISVFGPFTDVRGRFSGSVIHGVRSAISQAANQGQRCPTSGQAPEDARAFAARFLWPSAC